LCLKGLNQGHLQAVLSYNSRLHDPSRRCTVFCMFGPFPAAARIWPKHISSDTLWTLNDVMPCCNVRVQPPRIAPGSLHHRMLTWQSVHHGLAPRASTQCTANDESNNCCVLVLSAKTPTVGIKGISAAASLRHGHCIAPRRTVQSQCKHVK